VWQWLRNYFFTGWARIEMPKTSRGEGNREEVSPSPADYGAWGTIISTPSGIRGGFGVFSA